MNKDRSWELVNPEGVVNLKPLPLNLHPSTLNGKTVLLRWNGKHNGNVFLDRIAELLLQEFKDISFIRSWEVAPETATTTQHPEKSVQLAGKLAKHKPHIAIGSQGD